MKKHITTIPTGTRRKAGIGYVVIHPGKDRAKYIQWCYANNMITLALEDGGYVSEVKVSKSIWNDIDFPATEDELGSTVFWVTMAITNKPVIIGVLNKNDEVITARENKAFIQKKTIKGIGEVLVDGNTGSVFITASGLTETGGDIFIRSSNKNKSSKLKINVSGNISFNSKVIEKLISEKLSILIRDSNKDSNQTSLVYEKGVGLNYKDEFTNEINTNKEGVEIIPKKTFKIGKGKEPIPLADTLNDLLDELSDIVSDTAQACMKITVTSASPGSPTGVPLNATEFTAISTKITTLKKKFTNFKSKTSSTD